MDLIEENERYRVYQLANGDHLPIAHPPATAEAQRPQELVNQALAALQVLEEARKAVQADESLSANGKIGKLEPIRAQKAARLTELAAELQTFTDYSDSYHARVFGPPPIESGDALTAAQDREIRDVLRASRSSPSMLKAAASDPRVMQAILRSPLPLEAYDDMARTAYARHVAEHHPEAAKVAAFQEAGAWAAEILPRLVAATAA